MEGNSLTRVTWLMREKQLASMEGETVARGMSLVGGEGREAVPPSPGVTLLNTRVIGVCQAEGLQECYCFDFITESLRLACPYLHPTHHPLYAGSVIHRKADMLTFLVGTTSCTTRIWFDIPMTSYTLELHSS